MRSHLLIGALLGTCGWGCSTAPSPGPAPWSPPGTPASADADDILDALAAWQKAHLPIDLPETHEGSGGERTLRTHVRNESSDVTCPCAYGAGSTTSLTALGDLVPGSSASVYVMIPSSRRGEAPELYLQCTLGWQEVPRVVGRTAEDVDQVFARWPEAPAGDTGITLSLTWTEKDGFVTIDTHRGPARVEPLRLEGADVADVE
jgi:hypothetical protein